MPKGGIIFNPKIYVANFGTLNRIFEHEIDTKESFQGSGYCFHNNCIEKNQNKNKFEEGTSYLLAYGAGNF